MNLNFIDRPSNKGTKLLLKVIKAIIIIRDLNIEETRAKNGKHRFLRWVNSVVKGECDP